VKRAIYLEPDFVLAHFALANHALRERHFTKTSKHFTNALALLARFQPEAVLPNSDGLAAGRLKELIESTMSIERRYD
jgi:chemotaxis protein methyltransferase CheR